MLPYNAGEKAVTCYLSILICITETNTVNRPFAPHIAWADLEHSESLCIRL